MKIKTQAKGIIRKIHKHKRLIITVIVVITSILVIVGVWLSYQGWNQYSDNYNQHFNNVKTDLDSVITQKTSKKTDAELIAKLNHITKTQTKIKNEINTFCDINVLIRWQSFIPQYGSKIKDCESKKNKTQQLISVLSTLTTYLDSEQRLMTIISSANDKTNQNNQSDKWKLIEPFWRQAIVNISKLSDTIEFKPIKTLASKKLTSVADAWKQLSSANDAKNRQNFEATRLLLSQAYASFTEISDKSKTESDKLVENFTKSYKNTFN